MSGGFELRNQIRHCKTVCIKRNLFLINYNRMRTQWTANGNRDAGSSCLCDRGLHRYLQNLGGGLNTPNPPSRYATAAILPTEDFSCVFWTSCGSFDRCHASNARYSTCIIMQMALDNGDTLWTGLRLISPSLKPSCWREYVIRKDKARVLSLSLSRSLCTLHYDYVHSMAWSGFLRVSEWHHLS